MVQKTYCDNTICGKEIKDYGKKTYIWVKTNRGPELTKDYCIDCGEKALAQIRRLLNNCEK